jgi:hypothetical protein
MRSALLVTKASPGARVPGYGRARLWIGISAVGTVVTLTAWALVARVPAAVDAWVGSGLGASLLVMSGYAATHALVQLPFDVFGGHLLPTWYGRSERGLGRFVGTLLRGVVVYAAVLTTSLCALLVGGRIAGVPGTMAAGAGVTWSLLSGRWLLARALARLEVGPPDGSDAAVFAGSDDAGFAGGVLGVLAPRRMVFPARWHSSLTPEQLSYAQLRRELARSSGTWWRGRIVALAFTLAGLGVAAVATGAEHLGTAGGTIELSLWFTGWSFLGLLTLPTLSRRGVAEVDASARATGVPQAVADSTARAIDADQDDEPQRAPLVEAIFHPIPSVQNRAAATGNAAPGAWDAARTAVYLGLSGGGLLGRAVHCNCGRPALWAFLPLD